MNKIREIIEKFSKKNIPNILPGDTVKVFQKIKEGDKERIQVFEGVVLAKKHGNEVGATITVRKVSKGVAIERIFPIRSPLIQKIEVIKRSKVRRAKLYFLRTAKGKRARLKRKEFDQEKINKVEEIIEDKKEEQPLEKDQIINDKKEDVPEKIEEVKEDTPEKIEEVKEDVPEKIEEVKEDTPEKIEGTKEIPKENGSHPEKETPEKEI